MKKTLGIIYTTISWWICVICAMYLDGVTQIAALVIFVMASYLVHFKFYIKDFKKFLIFYALAFSIGLLADGTLLFLGHYRFSGTTIGIFPMWLLALWLVFPLNFLHTFQKFLEKPWLCFVFGMIGGPLAYKAGPAFGILELSNNALYLVAVYWAFYMLSSTLFRGKTGSTFEA